MNDLISRKAAIDEIFNADFMIYEGVCAVGRRNYMTKEEACSIIDSLPSVHPEQRWIPCSERLPEEDGQYLCYIVNEHDNTLQYIMCCGFVRRKPSLFLPGYSWYPDDETASDNVVAWMPLPEPWKGVE